MLPILWLPSARDDLRQIVAYIAKENIPAARRLKIRIETSVLALSEHPYLYPPSDRVSGLREIVVHPNYIVLYRVAASSIEIANKYCACPPTISLPYLN
jgi:toxin ParE1/3/4